MTVNLADYIATGRTLDADSRLEAARQLLLSVDSDPADDADDAWDEEIERRVTEVMNGDADLVDGRASHARIRAEIAAERG